MKKLLAIFRKSFLFPFTALFGGIPVGASGAADEDDEKEERDGTAGEGDGGPDEEQPEDNEGDKPVNMTQKQLDELIKKTLRRGERKGRAATGKKEDDKDEADKADERLKQANERFLRGTVKDLAFDLGITKKGASAALKLADFTDCFKDGEIDEEAVKDALEDFANEYPEFKKTDEPEKSWGMKQGKNNTSTGVEQAFKKLNPNLKF